MSFESIAIEVAALVSEKHIAYGNSFGKAGDILKILYPNGVAIDQYTDMLTIIRMLDKLFRIATSKNAFQEDPFKDLLGYCLLALKKEADEKEQ